MCYQSTDVVGDEDVEEDHKLDGSSTKGQPADQDHPWLLHTHHQYRNECMNPS